MSNYGEKLRKERRTELAQRALPIESFNEYGEVFAATKTEAGKSFPAGDYAYVPDAEKPSTWKLRLTSTPGGTPDPQIVGAAIAALGAGFRGNKVQIPADELPGVKAKVKAAWIKANPDKDKKEMPSVIASGSMDIDETILESDSLVACGDSNSLELSVKVNDVSATPSPELTSAVGVLISAAKIAYAGYDVKCDIDVDDKDSALELDIDLDGISQTPSEGIKSAFDALVAVVKSSYGAKFAVEVDIDVDSKDEDMMAVAEGPEQQDTSIAYDAPMVDPYDYASDGKEFGTLPPALKAALVKKLTAQLAKEKDPKKKADIEAKIKKYS